MFSNDIPKKISIICAHSAAAWGRWARSHGTGQGLGWDFVTIGRDNGLGIESEEEIFVVDMVAEPGKLERSDDRPCLRRLLPALKDLDEPRRLAVGIDGERRTQHRLEGRECHSIEGLVDVGAMWRDVQCDNPVLIEKPGDCRFCVGVAVAMMRNARL